jgi:acetolactate synthase-1/2/3 large subunit
LLLLDTTIPWVPGADSPPHDAKIAWVGEDPVNGRLKTFEFRADMWLPATSRNLVRAVHEAATRILTRSDMTRIAQRRAALERRKRERDAEAEREGITSGSLAHPTGRWAAFQLGRLLAPDAILLNDGLSNGGLVRGYCPRDLPGTYFMSGGSAGGWGVGAAFGAKLAAPDRDMVLATGDGYFEFGAPSAALWAASHHKAPFLTLVFVNGSYSTGTLELQRNYPDGHGMRASCAGGTFEPPPDYAMLARACGGFGEYVEETSEVGPALRRGLDATRQGAPAVVAVRLPSLAR